MTRPSVDKSDTSSLPQDHASTVPQCAEAAADAYHLPPHNAVQRFRAGLVRSFSSLRHRNYRLYFVGHLFSTIGAWAQRAAVGYLVWEMTLQERMLGIVGAVGTAPMTLLSVFGGLVAERFERRQIILFTQISATIMPALVAIMLIFWPEHVSIGLLIAMTLVHGIIMAFDVPARQSFVVEMVGKHDLPNAVALNSLTFNLSRTLGPAIGSVLLVVFGAAACFIANALSYFLLVAALLRMKLPRMSLAQQRGARMRHPLGGFYYVASHKPLGMALMLLASLSIFAWSMINILPSLASRHFAPDFVAVQAQASGQADGATKAAAPGAKEDRGDDARRLPQGDKERYGWSLSLFGFGAFLGAMFMAYVDRGRRRQPLILTGILLYAAGTIGFTSIRSLPLAAGFLAMTGLGMLIAMIGISSFIQMSVSDRFRGRVMGLYTLGFAGLMPIGSLQIGWLAEWLGPALAIQVNLLALLTVAAIVAPVWRRMQA